MFHNSPSFLIYKSYLPLGKCIVKTRKMLTSNRHVNEKNFCLDFIELCMQQRRCSEWLLPSSITTWLSHCKSCNTKLERTMQETLSIHRFNTLGFEYLQSTMKVCDVLIGSFAEVQIRITCTLKLALGSDWGASELD